MAIIRTSLFAILFLTGCASANSQLDQLTALLVGEFDTHAKSTALPVSERFVDTRLRIDAPDLGTHVLYQQLNKSESLDVYRQRIVILATADDGKTVIQTSYSMRHPERYVDASADRLSGITLDALKDFMPNGCEQRWVKTDNGFRGYVNPKTCRVVSTRTQKLRAIESENIVNRDSIYLVERGYDAESGKQLFGTPQGQSLQLDRVR